MGFCKRCGEHSLREGECSCVPFEVWDFLDETEEDASTVYAKPTCRGHEEAAQKYVDEIDNDNECYIAQGNTMSVAVKDTQGVIKYFNVTGEFTATSHADEVSKEELEEN